MTLLLRDVEVEGGAIDVRIVGDRIVEMGVGLQGGPVVLDAAGGALIPGLVDHHLHILATAARRSSVALDDIACVEDIGMRVASVTGQGWIRATGCPARLAEDLTRDMLDDMVPDRPLRVQDQTGMLWILNSMALDMTGPDWPDCVERNERSRPTGRVWRGDLWLRGRIAGQTPDLAPLGMELARYGVTALTDASYTNDAASAALLADAVRTGALPQRLMLMSAAVLPVSADGTYAVGPVKIMLDTRALPSFDEMLERIAEARVQQRCVAVHCVTAVELVFTLAAFAEAGCRDGDRIEHGSLIPEETMAQIAELGLRVVTQAGFLAARGDRYLSDVPHDEQDDLYRAASLRVAGIRLAGSSDAPYGPLDPWIALSAAVTRQAPSGRTVAATEALNPREALDCYLSPQEDPGGPPIRLHVGMRADLCLLDRPLHHALVTPSSAFVAATIIGGRCIYRVDAQR